tara:strand:- start:128 stop:352 length:225 start_codon:yes stop_codon:yes gene_type:complete
MIKSILQKRYTKKINNINLNGDDIAEIATIIVDEFIDDGLCPNYGDRAENPSDETHFEYEDIIREHLETLFKIK